MKTNSYFKHINKKRYNNSFIIRSHYQCKFYEWMAYVYPHAEQRYRIMEKHLPRQLMCLYWLETLA